MAKHTGSVLQGQLALQELPLYWLQYIYCNTRLNLLTEVFSKYLLESKLYALAMKRLVEEWNSTRANWSGSYLKFSYSMAKLLKEIEQIHNETRAISDIIWTVQTTSTPMPGYRELQVWNKEIDGFYGHAAYN